MDTTSTTIGWGVLAPGRIAHNFVRDLTQVPDARLVASGSRSLERAEAFAAQHGGRAHGSYAELVADPEVDVVYVASPHTLHEEHTMLALDAGKAVLCEKPMTLDAAATQRLVDAAAERGLFLMEAMWMACNPVVRRITSLLGTPEAPGEHGVARQVHADLGFVVDRDPSDRLLDPSLGGGALLDMGIYPLTFAHLVLGEPEQLVGVAGLSDRGVDLDVAIAGRYAGGATAALTASMSVNSPRTASVATTTGRFDLEHDFHSPTRVLWTAYDGKAGTSTWLEGEEPVIGRGYGNEVVEVHRCLRAGALTSELAPPARTVSLARQMDDLLAQVGVSYDG
ncbi:Gfo/Idh/MocA family protein [Nocardioides aurantiacus]|uniref:Putative dehydrogenase n=1 Tax=Nocardioides aurantiacus TaxID=86796 RepID=A0A3N2CY62_9ACTN|nr:Gfo/Idh/MocA family oxidoreductase [Nocardioides aurantiacus]ROR92467.1 putative dehydrogenase [Nocardioides aurantiacus]